VRILVLICWFFSGQALGWGPTGHRTVGLLAEKFMTVNALHKARQILNGQSLSRVSTWPDEIRSEPKLYGHTFPWHFTDWPDGNHQHDETHSPGKLISAIHKQLQLLRDTEVSQDKKAFALKFLVHLVGDLHMPLHVGNGLDRGGNDCKILFHQQEMSLHELWDEGMINFTRLSFTELADFVLQGRSARELNSWRGGEVLDWAFESRQLRNQLYPAEVMRPYLPGKPSLHYCRKDIQLPRSELPQLGFDYSYRFMPVVEQRLLQAGLRLAVLLNSVL
jgi:hypothetical protein